MTKDRCEALEQVLLSVSHVKSINRLTHVNVYDSSNEENYEKNKRTISIYGNFVHHKLNNNNAMAENWESAVVNNIDDYVLLVSDRSILKADIIERAVNEIESDRSLSSVCWSWDRVTNGNLLKYCDSKKKCFELGLSDLVLSMTYYGAGEYPYYLPRGLNCLLKKEVIHIIIEKFGCVYEGINPDYVLAFKLIVGEFKVKFINKSLFISKFTELSNGGNSSIKLNYNSIRTIKNYHEILSYTDIDLPLCSNTIVADYLYVLKKFRMDSGSKEILRKKLIFAGCVSILLEIKRFYSLGIIDFAEYKVAKAKLKILKQKNGSISIGFIQFVYGKTIEILPIYIFNFKRFYGKCLKKAKHKS